MCNSCAYDEAMKDKGAHEPDEEKPGKKPEDEMVDISQMKKEHTTKTQKKSHTHCNDDGECQWILKLNK